MGKGGYFNNNARRSGGDRHAVIYAGDPARPMYLKILKEKIAGTGLTGADLQEVYDRLDATETAVLRELILDA